MSELYIQLTNKEKNKLEQFLKSATLKGFEVPIYTEIIDAINNPVPDPTNGRATE